MTPTPSQMELWANGIVRDCLLCCGGDVGAGLAAAELILSTQPFPTQQAAFAHDVSDEKRDDKGRWTKEVWKYSDGVVEHDSWQDLKPESEYVYHATNTENAADVQESALVPHKPSYGTHGQRVWPDGSTAKRIYMIDNPADAWKFAPEEGKPALLRIKRHKTFKVESTGDVYLEGKKIPSHLIEILTKDGWKPLKNPPDTTTDKATLSLSAFFAYDIANRHAQGILNRTLKAAKGLTDNARKDLAVALKDSATDSGQAILEFIDKYRLQLAKLLTTTQLASLLEGAREVSAKVPALEDDAEAIGPAPQPTFPRQDGIHLVTIEEAAKQLGEKNVLTRDSFDALEAAARAKAFTVAGVDASDTLEKIRDVLSKNVKEGADYDTFKSQVMAAVDEGTFLSDAHTETVFRTNVQGAFSDGQMAVLQNPFVRSGFPYSAYDSIHDDRVRPEHLSLDRHGIDGSNIYRTDDPVFQTFRPPWDYCLPGDVLITTRRGRVRIDEIVDGDKVMTHKGRFRSVFGTHRTEGITKLVTIQLESGAFCRATSEHRVFTKHGWIEASSVNVGDEVYQVVDATTPHLVVLKVNDGLETEQLANGVVSLSVRMSGVLLKLHTHIGKREVEVEPKWEGLLVENELNTSVEPAFLKGGGKSFLVATHTDNAVDVFSRIGLDGFAPSGDHLGTDFRSARAAMDAVRSSNLFGSVGVKSVVNPVGVPNPTSDDAMCRKNPTQGTESNPRQLGDVGKTDLLLDVVPDGDFESARVGGKPCLGVIEIGSIAFWLFPHNYNCNIVPTKVKAVREVPWDGPVYNFGVKEDQSYIADGVVVHNCCRCSWTPITVRQAAEAGVKEAREWLDTGVEPSPPHFVAMPPFEPPPGFQRALTDTPLSIRLSLQPMATFSIKEGDRPEEQTDASLLYGASEGAGPTTMAALDTAKESSARKSIRGKRGKGKSSRARRRLFRRLRVKKKWAPAALSTDEQGNKPDSKTSEHVNLIADILVILFKGNAPNVAKKLVNKKQDNGAAFAFNAAGTIWHGPTPPSPTGWVQIAPGPRGGLRWVSAAGVASGTAPTPGTPVASRPAVGGGTRAIQASTAAHAAAMAKLNAGQPLTAADKAALARKLTNMPVGLLRSLHAALGGSGAVGGKPALVASVRGILTGATPATAPTQAAPSPPPTPPVTPPSPPPAPVPPTPAGTTPTGQASVPTPPTPTPTPSDIYNSAMATLNSGQQLTPSAKAILSNNLNSMNYSRLSSLYTALGGRNNLVLWGNHSNLQSAVEALLTPPTPPVPTLTPAPSPLHRGANVITGKPALVNIPRAPANTPPEVWETGVPKPGSLHGIPFAPAPHHFWEKVADVDVSEPPPNPKVTRAGILIQEPDGRVWICAPTNGFGRRNHTLPGGTLESGLSTQQNALKEVWEETGLQVEITGYAGDFNDSNYPSGQPGERFGRLYIGKRVGGAPWDAKVESHIISNKTNKPTAESETVTLVTPDQAAKLLHRTDDLAQLMVVHPPPIDTPVKGTGSGALKKLVEAIKPAADAYKAKKTAAGEYHGNAELHAVQELRGFNKKPKVVPQSDFDALMAKGEHIEMLRGVATSGSVTGKQMADQFRNGDHFPGHGIYGSGTYADSNNGHNHNVAASYASDNYGNGGALMRIALPKTAKVIKVSDLEKAVSTNPDAFKRYSMGKEAYECWMGVQAALAGYDAIHMDGNSSRHGDYGKGFYSIVNRSILTVQDKNPPIGYQIP